MNYIVLFAISGLFLLNLIQYRLYLNNPSSYIVDDRIKDYHIKNEILKIDSLISYYKKEQSLCKEVLTKTPSKKFIPKYENYNFAITSPLKSISGNFFMVEENEIYFRLICKDPPPTPIPVSIVSKFNGKTYGYDVLEIVYSNYDIEIVQNKVNKDYFNSLNILSDSIQSDLIKMIINTNISDKQNKIVILSENKKSIVKRGLPIGIFLIDSLKSLFGSYQDYKPLNWIGRIIEIFQILFAFIFTMPLFGEPYILLKKKLLK
ncbi:MAG: hypothetical protein HOO91_21550 [Bacteroidales bacterium]|nr:hypothetical protein [Bacteroidales bacterium]